MSEEYILLTLWLLVGLFHTVRYAIVEREKINNIQEFMFFLLCIIFSPIHLFCITLDFLNPIRWLNEYIEKLNVRDRRKIKEESEAEND